MNILLGVLIVWGALVCYALGFAIGRDVCRRDAVLENAAHWEADEDGKAKFTWGPKATTKETEK